MTNRARASAGLKALKVDSTLHSVARWRSKDMIDRNYFSHAIPGYGKVFKKLDADRLLLQGRRREHRLEQLPGRQRDRRHPELFMGSPGHRANILGKTWDVIGIGAYKGADGKKMWTVLFADKCGSTRPRSRRPSPRPEPKPKPTARPTPRPTPSPTPSDHARPTPKAATRRPSPDRRRRPAPTTEPGPERRSSPGDNRSSPRRPHRRRAVGTDLDPGRRRSDQAVGLRVVDRRHRTDCSERSSAE